MITNKEEVGKAAENYCNIQNIYPSDTALSKEVFIAGALMVESKVQEYVGDIIIENQGLKLYKDNEAERFKEIALEFVRWIVKNRYDGYTPLEEKFDKFLKEKDGLVNS